jgi:hypothetical protein
MTEFTGEKQGHGWKPGQSGNPSGRPKGALNHTTRAVLALLGGEAEALTRKAIERALEGDTVALRLCLERLAPPAKDKPISLSLPLMRCAEDASKALAGVLEAMSKGKITPSEATATAGLIETYRRTLETTDFEKRLVALEEKDTHR